MSKIQKLRTQLKQQALDGFIVPRGDEHMGEYVAPHSERLAWLTEFKGSAGCAIVLDKKASVFVDGRYTLQAQQQVDTSLFDINKLGRQQCYQWLNQHTTAHGKVGFDPWLHPIEEIESLGKGIAPLTLVPLAQNPIDQEWTDKPLPPSNPVYIYPDHFAGKTRKEKCANILKIMAEKKADALLLTTPDSICWLLNVRGSDVPCNPFALSLALVHANGQIAWFIDPAKVPDNVKTDVGHDITLHDRAELEGFLTKLSGKTLWLDPMVAPYWFALKAEEFKIKTFYSADPVNLAKSQKNPIELENIRKAHIYDGIAMCKFLSWLHHEIKHAPVTEVSAATKLLAFRKERSAFVEMSFPSISSSGSNAAVIHYQPTAETDKPLTLDQIYLIDSGGQYFEGTTDVTRTLFFGTPSAEIKDRYTRVLKGHIALSQIHFPKGTTGYQLDILARAALWQQHLNYEHGTGHGVGCYLSVHEGPQRIANWPNSVQLLPGMILSNEPGFYKNGEYGIRIENLIAIHDEGEGWMSFENLTMIPIATNLIDLSLLSQFEKDWINHYHREVFDKIHAQLNADEQAWLKEATRAI